MAVSFVNAGAIVNGAGGPLPALPASLVTDDILLMFCETAAAEAISVANPNGGTWTEVANSPQSVGNVRLTVFWSRYNGTQTAPQMADPGDHATAIILAFRGCAATGDPWNVTVPSTQTATTAGSITGGTTTVDGCMVVAAVACDSDLASTTNASGWTNASLTNLTERVDQTFAGGSGGGLAIATGEKATAGTVDATTWTQAATDDLANLMIALKPPDTGVSQIPNATTSNDGWDTAPLAGQAIHTYIATDDDDYITVTV